jgi:hypothetical protein
MAKTSQSALHKQTHRGKRTPAAKPPVIDNRRDPSTEEVARILNVPPNRVRQLKDLAAKTLKPVEVRP